MSEETISKRLLQLSQSYALSGETGERIEATLAPFVSEIEKLEQKLAEIKEWAEKHNSGVAWNDYTGGQQAAARSVLDIL